MITHDELVELVATSGRMIQVLIDSMIRNSLFDVSERARIRRLMEDLDEQLNKIHDKQNQMPQV